MRKKNDGVSGATVECEGVLTLSFQLPVASVLESAMLCKKIVVSKIDFG